MTKYDVVSISNFHNTMYFLRLVLSGIQHTKVNIRYRFVPFKCLYFFYRLTTNLHPYL